MKTINYFFTITLLVAGLFACTDNWDTHYNSQENEINNATVTIVNSTAVEYLKSESTYSSMYSLFSESSIIETIQGREQLFTILVVNNNNATNSGTEDKIYLAKSHISDVALSPENLSHGQRLLMWTNKAVSITKETSESEAYNIAFNSAKVTKIIKTNDAYIYELDTYIDAPKSMYEIIEDLGDDYSIFRDMILSRNQREFNKDASIPIGVDNTGSTVYDSVFIITNPYFSAQNFDIMSESLNATMLIPSNEVVNNALNTARENLNLWGLTRNDEIIEDWIFQSAFFKEQYNKQDFIDKVDLTSIFGKQWRTTVQHVDLDNPVSMSNGVAYYVQSMKIPTNILIYRLKDFYKWYEFLTETDKEKYFPLENLAFDKIATEVNAWSGWPAGGFPMIENRVLYFNLADKDIQEYKLHFVPFQFQSHGDGTYTASPYLIPPGEYDLCLGFKQNLGHNVEISFNGEAIREISTSEFTSTTYHYDRGGQGYPEGYDTSKATDSKKGNYDRDGGRIGVVTIEGTEAVPVQITIHGINVTNNRTILHHWCLRPTKNCY
jgi:hypothetical protein